MFRRSKNNYGKGGPPETPYMKAAKAWDDRIGSARVQAASWRAATFGVTVLTALLIVAYAQLAMKSQVATFVVQIDEYGKPARIQPTSESYKPSERLIGSTLARWVKLVRSKPADPVVIREQWDEAYNYVGQHASGVLSEYAREHDPFKNVGKHARSVAISNVVKKSEATYQVRWEETSFENGATQGRERYTGLFTVEVNPPRDEEAVYRNPLGITITELNWSKEMQP